MTEKSVQTFNTVDSCSLTSQTPWRPAIGMMPSGRTPRSASQPDRLTGGSTSRCVVKSARDCRPESVMDSGEQRAASSSLEGEQSPWKYRVWVAGNGGSHYGLVGGVTPCSRSAPNQPQTCGRQGVGGRAERDRRLAPVERHRCGKDDLLFTARRLVQACRTSVRRFRGARSPGGLPAAGKFFSRSWERHHLGGGVDQPASIHTMTKQSGA